MGTNTRWTRPTQTRKGTQPRLGTEGKGPLRASREVNSAELQKPSCTAQRRVCRADSRGPRCRQAHVEGLLEHPLPRLRQRGVSSYPSMPASRGTERRRSRFEASAQGPRSLKAASSAGTPRSQRRECGCFDCIEAWPGSSKRPRRSFIHLHMKLCFANGKLHGPEATVSMDTSVPVASTRACGRDIASQCEAVPPARRA